MNLKKVSAVLAAGVLAFALAGCSGSQAQNKTIDAASVEGYWALDSGSDLGLEAYLSLTEDTDEVEAGDDSDSAHYFELQLSDSYLSGTWSASGTEGTLVFDDINADSDEEDSTSANADTAKFTFDGTKLTLGSADGSKLVFVKDDSDKVKEVFGIYEESIESMDAVSVAEDDNFEVKVTGKGNDEYGDEGYQVSVTNNTDKNVFIECDGDFKINGEDAAAYFLMDEAIAKGETADCFLALDVEADSVKSLSGTLNMYDDDAVEALYEAWYDKMDEDESLDESEDEDALSEGPDISSALIASYPITLG